MLSHIIINVHQLILLLEKKHNIHTVSGIRLTLSGNGTVKIRFNLHTSMERHQQRLILTYFRLCSVFYFKNTEYQKKNRNKLKAVKLNAKVSTHIYFCSTNS